jgi:DNA mismatch repair ATPase MutS
VTFLYQLMQGACPKSYGTSCARLAGMPECILARAEELATKLEHGRGENGANTADGTEDKLQTRELEWLRGLPGCLHAPGNASLKRLRELQEQAKASLAIEMAVD